MWYIHSNYLYVMHVNEILKKILDNLKNILIHISQYKYIQYLFEAFVQKT